MTGAVPENMVMGGGFMGDGRWYHVSRGGYVKDTFSIPESCEAQGNLP